MHLNDLNYIFWYLNPLVFSKSILWQFLVNIIGQSYQFQDPIPELNIKIDIIIRQMNCQQLLALIERALRNLQQLFPAKIHA